MAAITHPFFASVSSSTAFGHSCILLAPAPRDRHHRRSRRVAEAYRQLCSRANKDDNDGGHCAGDVEADSASTLVGSEDGDDKVSCAGYAEALSHRIGMLMDMQLLYLDCTLQHHQQQQSQ